MAQTATKPREKDHAEASGCGSHGTFCWNELSLVAPASAG